MRLIIKGKNFTLDEKTRAHVEKKLSVLQRYSDKILDCAVEFQYTSKKKEVVKAEITLHIPGALLRAEEKNSDLVSAFQLSLQKLKKRLVRYKGKKQQRNRNTKKKVPFSEQEDASGLPSLVKEKTFPMQPMSVEEAILNLTNLGHDFYVFQNRDTETMNIVYKRRDKTVGLLRPKLPH